MSDNLCGPSAPHKGLLNQLDRDNSRHQTRSVTPRGPFDKNFRTSAEAANSSTKDADLKQFLAGPGPSPGPLVPFPMGGLTPNTSAGPSYQARFQNPTHGHLPQQQNSQGALFGESGHASVDWVNDFRKMQLNNNQREHSQGNAHLSGGPAPSQVHPAYAPPIDHALHPLPTYANQFSNPYHAGPFLGGAQTQSGVQQTNTFEDPSMAPSNQTRTDEILAELFAEYEQAAETAGPETKPFDDQTKTVDDEARLRYEQNFQEEMDQWMAVNGRSAEPEPQTTAPGMMEGDDLLEQMQHSGPHDPILQPQEPVDEEAQHQRNLEDDYQLRKAAQDIMTTLSTNQSEKFKNSTFIDLMNRICQKEVVLQGNDLFDTTTGTVLGNNTTDTAEPPEQAHDPKGKGKAVETPFPAQNAA